MLKQKDQQGISVLYHHYASLIFGLIYKIVRKKEVAEEALQDTFLKVWRNIETYDDSKGMFIAWVMKIARNAAIDRIRSKSERQNDHIVPLSEVLKTDQHSTTELKVEHLDLRDKVKMLEPPYQQVIELAFFHGFTHREIAKELNLPLGTVKGRIRKAFSELKTIFAG